ncbi:MAG: c-type cytochrome [Acidobacteriia bacterium]|nr:c-type cytochrome [Terriglobia bacterium]
MRQLTLIAMALTFACPGARAQAPAAKPVPSAENGRKIYSRAGCYACHGAQGEGTNLALAIAPPPVELSAMISYMRQPTGKMPAVPIAAASDQQLGDVYAFLKSLAPASSSESLAGNADNGKKLFASYGCYQCHGHQGAGAATAPRIAATALSLTAVIRYVRAPTGQMPPYTSKVVSDQDLADIYAFLKTFSPPAPASSIPLLNP